MTPDQARALAKAIEQPRVREAAEKLVSGEDLIKVRSFLEETFPPSTCLALLDCLVCRQKFTHKFESIERWLLTREAAEQATSWQVARWRASLLAESFPDAESLLELGCGIGGDSVYLGSRFKLTAFESDLARAHLSQKNFERNCRSPVSGSQILARCADLEKSRGELLYADPARRTHRRLFRPEDWTPPLHQILRAAEDSRFSAVTVKCHPGLLDSDVPTASQVHFISVGRALKEAFLLLKVGDKTATTKTAWIWDSNDGCFCSHPGETGESENPLPILPPKPDLYLHNPDPALLRARALQRLSEDLHAGLVHPKIGYLVGPQPCDDNRCESFHINDVFPLNWKDLHRKIGAANLSSVEILGRGLPFSAEEIRRRISKALKANKMRATENQGVLIFYRAERGYSVVLARRAPKPRS